jgi:hypothetical protein
MKRDPGYYDFLPYQDRPPIRWPNGAQLAFWVAPNIEFYELSTPHPTPSARPGHDRCPMCRLIRTVTTATGWACGA